MSIPLSYDDAISPFALVLFDDRKVIEYEFEEESWVMEIDVNKSIINLLDRYKSFDLFVKLDYLMRHELFENVEPVSLY